jgi:hypothetical protein
MTMVTLCLYTKTPAEMAKELAVWLLDPRTQQDCSCATEREFEDMLEGFLVQQTAIKLPVSGEVH